ncbi:phosphoribosylglycinamide formyltransferase [Aggregatibacter aphrophilus]|uniref:Phosphoribosylglycinamide formyltransferase n=2 Tax=Aggregatibacter aphrophilus TaxID=732 RepID=A0A3S4QA28_AGGAP|nr:phosphoribosylglycinamide formyltransferase [Aggregatibacter aphrophilus]KNE84716.1 phosphoribosylglycinamide formyltransferase [Aggregatibacter aphrophilus ATCC 33389]OBY53871.1 phosphoribosylglycinamide formyltransferase [Aggregatibacter aphrophilus]RDE83585.1 phosphoribosylglycinamide formyltransferase [Aggregatibacter aphrophilus]RDE89413.1 phosphoribosylglycinamide formyltransferase [Aggregatibacter aphrophilus]SQI95834.1 Phosphoribosylglycinamide formyltransferase [Aggregatibacter aph
MKKIVVLISGHGMNLQALIDACKSSYINAEIVGVFSNKSDAFGLQRAKSAGIFHRTFLRSDYANNLDMDRHIGDEIDNLGADLIVLAGYMKILSSEFTHRFAGKILNIHPSLLPKYSGLHTYQRAMEAGETEHGMTIHFVNEKIDGGAIVLQAKVPIFPEDNITDIEDRVKEQEIRFYPLVIKWFVEGRLRLIDNHAYLDGNRLPPQGYAID